MMADADAAARIGPYLERLIDNGYAQENLREAAANLRAAYDRASKRRVKMSRDEKVRRHVRQAAHSLSEAGNALKTDRKRPRRRWGRRLSVLLGLGAVSAAAILAANEELRKKVFGGGLEGGGPDAAATPPASESVPT
jgi:ferric-dicitrate binding protein FerR (iron transport regulator)